MHVDLQASQLRKQNLSQSNQSTSTDQSINHPESVIRLTHSI